jgi:hypothetical protein
MSVSRCTLQCLIGSCVGEDFFVSLVEGGDVGAGIVHGSCSYTFDAARGGNVSSTKGFQPEQTQ